MSYSRDASVIIATSYSFVNSYFRIFGKKFLAYFNSDYFFVISVPLLRWIVFAGITPRTHEVGYT